MVYRRVHDIRRGEGAEFWTTVQQVVKLSNGFIQCPITRVAYHRKKNMLIGLLLILLDGASQQLVPPQLIHAAAKRAGCMIGMIDKKISMSFGDPPVVESPDIVVIADRGILNKFCEVLVAVVAHFSPIALETTAIRKLPLGQLVLDKPKAECALVVTISNGNIRIGPRPRRLIA